MILYHGSNVTVSEPRLVEQNRKRLHYLLREDLAKMDEISEKARLLARHHIDTDEQLFLYKSDLKSKIEALTGERDVLFHKRRTLAVKSDKSARAEMKDKIDLA